MPNRWKGVGHKWKLKEAQKLGTLSIAKMSLQEKAELAQFYYNQFQTRSNQFVRAGVIPYAWTKMFRDYQKVAESNKVSDLQRAVSLESPIVKRVGKYRELAYPFSEMTNPGAPLTAYIRRMQAFFEAKTSTIAGWREVSLAQDISLFGGTKADTYHYEKDEYGKRHRVYDIIPNETLSEAERIKVWEIIDLAKDEGWLNRFGYDSKQAHRDIASLFFTGKISSDDIEKARKDIADIMDAHNDLRHMYSDTKVGDKHDPFHRTEEGGNTDKNGQSDLLSEDDTVF